MKKITLLFVFIFILIPVLGLAQGGIAAGLYALNDGDMSAQNDIVIRLYTNQNGEYEAVEVRNGHFTGQVVLRFIPPGTSRQGFGQPLGFVFSQHLYPRSMNQQWIQLYDVRFRANGFSIFARNAAGGWHYYRVNAAQSQPMGTLTGEWNFPIGARKNFVHRGGNYYEGYFTRLSSHNKYVGSSVGDLSYRLWRQGNTNIYKGQVKWR